MLCSIVMTTALLSPHAAVAQSTAEPALPVVPIVYGSDIRNRFGAVVAPRQRQSRPNRPLVYKGRRIAQTMSYLGADWLERPERLETEEPDKVVESLKLRPGDVAADIGAGTGYFSLRMAKKVGPRGRIIATDIQPEMLELLQRNMERARVANVDRVLCTSRDTGLKPDSIDLAIMVDVYHEMFYPEEAIVQIRKALKKNGRLVLVEYRGEDPRVPIKPLHKMTVRQIRYEIEPLGFKLSDIYEFLVHQHIVIFSKDDRSESQRFPQVAVPGGLIPGAEAFEQAGFEQLLVKGDLQGWISGIPRQVASVGNWLRLREGASLFRSADERDFELSFQWKRLRPDGEASVVIRATRDSEGRVKGHHVLLARNQHAAVLTTPGSQLVHKSSDKANAVVLADWNTTTIRAVAGRVGISINGAEVAAVDSNQLAAEGGIGFDVVQGDFMFREVWIKRL